jgi:hypothetical protein
VGRTWRGKFFRLIQIRFIGAEFGKIAIRSQDNSPQARIADSSSRNAVSFSSACEDSGFQPRRRHRDAHSHRESAFTLRQERNLYCLQGGLFLMMHFRLRKVLQPVTRCALALSCFLTTSILARRSGVNVRFQGQAFSTS